MKRPDLFLRHRYTVFALVLVIITGGIYAQQNLEVSLFPNTSPPTVNVLTSYPGAAAEDVARDVAEPMEEEFATLEDVSSVKSTVQNGLSVIGVEFEYGTDLDIAAVNVQNAISMEGRELPPGLPDSRVLKFSTSDRPVITYGLTGNKVDLTGVRSLAEDEIKDRLQLVEGVAVVDVFGGHQRQVNVQLDRERLKAMHIAPAQVAKSLKQKNSSGSAGSIDYGDKKYTIRFTGEYASVEEIQKTVIAARKGSIVRVDDVAKVVDAVKDTNSAYRLNGKKAIALYVLKKDDANTVKVVNAVQEEVDALEKDYPYLGFNAADNESTFTRQVVSGMTGSIGYALVLTVLVILLFIVSLNESLVVALSMPLTFLSTLGLMNVFGKELNMITMSALILSVGIVVDNSIVVVENISRHRSELGKDFYRSAVDGTAEIMLPLFAGAITTVVVLVPMLFQKGFVGKTFGPLSSTLIMAILSSLLISVVIIPLLVVLLHGRTWVAGEKMAGFIAIPFFRGINLFKSFYLAILNKAIKRRTVTIILAVLILFAGARLIAGLGMEVLPSMDAGTSFISFQTRPGTNLQETTAVAGRIESILDKEKEVINYNTRLGYEKGSSYLGESGVMDTNQGYITVNFTSRKEREKSIWDIQEQLRGEIAKIPGIDTFVVKEQGNTAVATTAAPVDIRISGKDPKVLNHLAGQVMKKLEKVPGGVNLRKSWSLQNPEIQVDVDEERAAQLGLSPEDVKQQVFSVIEGSPASELVGEEVDINVRYREKQRKNLEDLKQLRLSSPLGIQFPLKQVAIMKIAPGPDLVTRENMQRTIDVLGDTYSRPFSHIMGDIEKKVQKVQLPEGYSIEIAGEQADLASARSDLLSALGAAVILVYLVLMLQFKSFVHPVTIMLAIPLVLAGVALALLAAGKSVSMPVLLGLILLAGTVVNNSILLIDYIIKERNAGCRRKDAVFNAVSVRYRPIMMTALSDVAGMLPLALELALGSERFSPLATAIIGGILASTLLTMVVVPVVYTVFDDLKKIIRPGSSILDQRHLQA
ncbi:MAG: efflux RND transporter permease subunit [Clostridiales bacterium]|nr:efflux RND transporter permease subunit [Clostridiales bacterium]MCF8021487.1 efflux RND transporter permease subunit [Clostridiales bacterium]